VIGHHGALRRRQEQRAGGIGRAVKTRVIGLEVQVHVMGVLTVPFTGLRFIEAEPLFSPLKRRAIRELAWDAATKVFLEFRERFWETRDGIYGGYTTTDRPNRFLYYPSHGLGDAGGGVLLASYTWANEARGWDSLTPEQRVRYALDHVAAIHGECVRELFVGGTSHSWAQDDFSLGEAAMFQPGQLGELQLAIAAPEGRVHFAGDHTTLRHAWIEGAIESGVRVAVEVSEGTRLVPLRPAVVRAKVVA
jgi:monoamine oxidase